MNHRRTPESRDTINVENLSALGRRHQLAPTQQRRLDIAIAASDALRCSHQLGCDFDELQTVCEGDAQLIEHLARRARVRYEVPNGLCVPSFATRALPWVAVASLLVVSAAAGANLWPYARALLVSTSGPPPSARALAAADPRLMKSRSQSLPVQAGEQSLATVTAPPGPSHQTTDVSRDVSGSETAAVAKTSTLAVPTPAAAPLMATTETEAARVSRLPQSAAVLFSNANSARRRGDISGARSLYERLRAAYPAANETAISYVLMARIDLRTRSARAALRQFDQYLTLAPAGPLAEEALEGRATAYGQMSMPAEETLTWRELLHRYPNSVYARAARKRLDELR